MVTQVKFHTEMEELIRTTPLLEIQDIMKERHGITIEMQIDWVKVRGHYSDEMTGRMFT